jgi:hypothetical protein
LGVKIALSPRIGISSEGLPLCRLGQLRDAWEAEAMHQCGDAVIGGGLLGRQAEEEFSEREKLIAFNGRYRSRPVILVYGSDRELRTRFISVIRLERTPGGAGYTLAGTITNYPYEGLEREYPEKWDTSRFTLSLHRGFLFDGRRRSYLAASCPVSQSAITVAHATFDFGERAQATGAVLGQCGPS